MFRLHWTVFIFAIGERAAMQGQIRPWSREGAALVLFDILFCICTCILSYICSALLCLHVCTLCNGSTKLVVEEITALLYLISIVMQATPNVGW